MMSRFLVLLLFATPAVAGAQESPAQIRHRVAEISDTVELQSLERLYASTSTTDASVAAGLTALRLWEVTGERTHARRSRKHFDRAVSGDPRSAWAHYGHALSLRAEMDRDPSFIVTHINASRALGLNPASRARRALERAVALDPDLPGAVELLAQYAAVTQDGDGLLQARTAFEQAAAASPTSTSALLGIAVTSRELGEYTESANAARRAVASNESSAAAHLELAISLASIPDSLTAAGQAYGAALQLADDELLERMWEDAALLQNTREAAAWRFAAPGTKRSMLRTFWGLRGALAGLTGDERAAEHYRRATVAETNFRRNGAFGASPPNALRWEKVSSTYDDRGIIYIRHGEPTATYGVPPLQSHLAWIYTGDEGETLSYHFAPGANSRDYILLRNLPCPVNSDLVQLDRRLSPLVWRCDELNVRSVSAMVGRDAERALASDSHRTVFTAALPFHYDWYTFRADAGTEVLMTVGVPLDRLPPGPRSLRIMLSVVDTMWATIAQTSRVTETVEFSAERGRILRTNLSLVSEPTGRDAYRIDVRDAADMRIGTVYGGDIRIPDYRGERLMVSDIVLAEPQEGGSEVRGERLALAPTQVFRQGEFRIYYELYNMPAAAGYATEITVEPLRDGGLRDGVRRLFGRGDGVQLRFEDSTPADHAGTLRQLRDMKVPFRPGAYLLSVMVRTPVGTVTQERRFTIEKER